MKFTKSWKRFWTMNRNHAGGFTLVELIVVIAILAILAGVAIPAYSGYINKAKESGDYTLLSAINTAFAAACIENGQSAAGMTGVTIDGYQKDSEAAITVNVYNDDFQLYLGDSKASNFEVLTRINFNSATGTFGVGNSAYNNLAGYFTGEDKEAYLGSVFAGLGADALLGDVGDLTGFGADLINSEGSSFYELVWGDPDDEDAVKGDTAFMRNLAAQMGYEDWENDQGKFFAELQGMANSDPNKMNQILANAAVLSAANKTAGMDTGFLTAGGLETTIKNNLDDPAKAEEGLAQASMAYAMYMAYANSDAGKAAGVTVPELKGVGDIVSLTDMLGDMNSEGFKTYMASPEGTADLAGYQAAMNMVNQSAKDEEALNSVLVNGFNDPDLIGILNSVVTAG